MKGSPIKAAFLLPKFLRRALRGFGLIKTSYREEIGRSVPLGRVPFHLMLAANFQEVHSRAIATGDVLVDKIDLGKVHATYPLTFERDGRTLRYALLPARTESKGLVVMFHAVNGFAHLSHVKSYEYFDVLAPLDSFGYEQRGSCFWGENGEGFLEPIVHALIDEVLAARRLQHWFTIGGSLGGFGALYHGIKYHASGMYIMTPQINLEDKIREEEIKHGLNNTYSYVRGATFGAGPNIYTEAKSQETLPPLMLIQSQYDQVNPFASHAFPLLDIYNEKGGWYGLRVYPAIGHNADGSAAEAEYFFLSLVEKQPPHQVRIPDPKPAK